MFWMSDAKIVGTHLSYHTKISIMQSPQSNDDKNITEGSYASGEENIIYVLVCSKLNFNVCD